MKFYYQIMGEEFGPVSSSELERLASERQIQPDTFVRKDGGNWHVAESVKGLFTEPSHELAESVTAEISSAEISSATLSHRRPPQSVVQRVGVFFFGMMAVFAVVGVIMQQFEEAGQGNKELAEQGARLNDSLEYTVLREDRPQNHPNGLLLVLLVESEGLAEGPIAALCMIQCKS